MKIASLDLKFEDGTVISIDGIYVREVERDRAIRYGAMIGPTRVTIKLESYDLYTKVSQPSVYEEPKLLPSTPKLLPPAPKLLP